MTVEPQRKLPMTPVLLGLFFLTFLVGAAGLLLQPGGANPFLTLSVLGMAVVGMLTIRKLAGRARDAEQALTEGERYIEAVAELSQDVHAIIETRSQSFLYLSPAVQGLLGFPQEALLKGGLSFFHSLVHPDDLPAVHKQFAHLAEPLAPGQAETVQEQNFRIRNHHGDYRWLRSRRNVFVRYPDGRPAEFLSVLQDITEQRSYETALVQAQKMETLGALTRGSVHGLNNTLMSIQGFAELALNGADQPQVLMGNLEQLQGSIQRASALCRQMVAYTGQGRVLISAHGLNEVVKESLSAIESLVPKGATLLLELQNDLPLANLDLNQARYALLNLVYNAAEALGIEGGEICLRTSLQQLAADPAGPGLAGAYLCLEVRDSGPAKPAEVLNGLCDPLFSSLHPGYGLGLSAVHGIMVEHGGGLRSMALAETGGATLLYFPLAQEKPELDAGDEGTPMVGASGVVLVVEDDPSIRTILRLGLESGGFKVIEAEDGVEGFGAFVRHRSCISAVLLDLTMPRMGGDEVFEEIHKMAPEVPVILMSGYSEDEATSALTSKGLAGFLSKPCSIKDTLAEINKVMAIKY